MRSEKLWGDHELEAMEKGYFQAKGHLDKVQGMTWNTKLITDSPKGNRPISGHVKSLTQIKAYLGGSVFSLLIAEP